MGKRGLEKSQKKAERLALLLEITRVINSSLEVEDIFRLLTVEIRRLFAFDRLDLALLNSSGGYPFSPPGGKREERRGLWKVCAGE
ncbi:MAG: hypothetical protein ACE5LG_04830 [Anaerolineae bacterium]